MIIRNVLLFMGLLLGLSQPIAAQSIGKAPITAELVEGWIAADGTRVSAIRLTLEPGWKTYWRAPGDAGIPPQFNWRRSKNLKGISVNWPTPQVFDQGGMQSIGYTRQVTFPLRIKPADTQAPVSIDVTMDIGVCSDICVPERLRVRGTLQTSNTKPVPAIVAALAERPYSGKEAGLRSATCRLQPNANGLEIVATLDLPKTGGKETVIIEPGQTGIWVSATDSTRAGRILTAKADMVAGSSTQLAINRSDIRITVLGRNKAVDIRGCSAG